MTDYTKKRDLLPKAIANGSFPRYLYKYRDASALTESIFSSKEMWFSSPTKFNDPFDCNLSEVDQHSAGDLETYYENMILGKPDEEVLRSIGPDLKKLEEIVEKAKLVVLSRTGVLCLSRAFNNILMWSHYANNHKGLVIEFDLKADPEFFLSPINISYTTEYQPTDFAANPHGSITSTISTKSSLWQYEGEVRIYKNGGVGLTAFHPNCIKRVLFGCKAEPDFIDKIVTLCKSDDLKHVKFSSMKMVRNKFALELVE